MAAHPNRPAVVQPPVDPGPGALHQEPCLAIAQDEVRDHLLEGGVRLHLRPRPVRAVGGDQLVEPGGVRCAKPAERPVGEGAIARNDEDLLDIARGLAHDSASRSRASRSRVANGATSGSSDAAARVEVGEPAVEHAPNVANAARERDAAFVAAIAAPISTSPFARRVVSRQPFAESRRTASQSSRRSPSRVEVTAPRARRTSTSGRWLIAATASSCVRRGHPHRLGARRPGEPLDALRRLQDGPANPAR